MMGNGLPRSQDSQADFWGLFDGPLRPLTKVQETQQKNNL